MPQNSRKMIFHIPLPLNENAVSASGIRPLKMIKGFEKAGFYVEKVCGNASERKTKCSEILNRIIKNGEKYDFCYSESSTMPTLLTDSHHLPLHPFVDFSFFNELKRYDIPIGLFYRDVFWTFDLYKKSVPLLKRLFALPFYKYDLKKYNELIDVLFLPSMKMLEAVPAKISVPKVFALPSGGEDNAVRKELSEENRLSILYVGGILPPLYDLTPLIEAVRGREMLKLTIVCRKNEYESVKERYKTEGEPNISIVHGTGGIVDECYRKADVFAILCAFYDYWRFAMPFKLIESVSHGVPVVTYPGTAVADFVESNGVGWVVDCSYGEFLQKLAEDRGLVMKKRENVIKAIPENTWEARALFVAEQLCGVKK